MDFIPFVSVRYYWFQFGKPNRNFGFGRFGIYPFRSFTGSNSNRIRIEFRIILTARIKKSSCIHETQPKFEYLNMRSIIHITRSAKRDLAVNRVMHRGTSAVDWWFGMNKILSSDTCSKGTRSPDSTTLYPAGKKKLKYIYFSALKTEEEKIALFFHQLVRCLKNFVISLDICL